MPEQIRVRFAPSPTGYFHVGGARTALYNWLFARRLGGSMVLRIEDTDTERNREEWVEGICTSLDWLGLDWDEGPFRQSERGELYAAASDRLRREGHIYYCGCTRTEIDERTSANATPGYDGHCRDLDLGPGPGRALRFRVPAGETVVVQDLIRGPVQFSTDSIEDFIVVKSSGAPLFVLAVVVDDMDMSITHVIRGEEHLPTTPKAILLWRALAGAAPTVPLPLFAHLPILVNEKRQKLSKRRDPVALEDYRSQGFLAEAMRNYLALLGWAPGDDREFLTNDEMVAEFRLEEVNHSPAFFDVVKLRSFNGHYMRRMAVKDFVDECAPWLAKAAWPAS
ncbi:MAG: glutamate--tRNA ligase, partial [Acidimicrobiales bacterium]